MGIQKILEWGWLRGSLCTPPRYTGTSPASSRVAHELVLLHPRTLQLLEDQHATQIRTCFLLVFQPQLPSWEPTKPQSRVQRIVGVVPPGTTPSPTWPSSDQLKHHLSITSTYQFKFKQISPRHIEHE